jgi:hypothetical protein
VRPLHPLRARWVGVAAEEESVEGDFARAEDEDDKSGEEDGIGIGGGEFVGIGENGEKSLAVGGDVGHEHVDGEDKADETREQADGEENAADEFDAGDKGSGKTRSGKSEAGEKFGDMSEIVEFAPAVLRDLPAPIDTDEEKEWRLESAGGANGPGVHAADGVHGCGHSFCADAEERK